MEKMGIYIARVHVDATWHLGPRDSATWTSRRHLRGANVTRGIFSIKYIGLPIIKRHIINLL